jgi:3,4-dihydroxy 2-butanone 4-phosphate synthase/GTP cyclohydrolase II
MNSQQSLRRSLISGRQVGCRGRRRDRENEGDLICAAQLITPALVNFMLKAKGMICLALTGERVDQLGLAAQGDENTDAFRTAFTVSIDAAPRFGVTTGISAADRAKTIQVAVDPATVRGDLRRPGHVHPLRARDGGVSPRSSSTSCAVSKSFAPSVSLYPAGVICEILNDDGSTMKRDDWRFATAHDLTFVTVAQLVAYRLNTERLVHRVAEARLPTDIAGKDWKIIGYRNDVDTNEHVALVYGDIGAGDSVLVRMHSKCLTGDVFHSMRCDCGWQLHTAMEMIPTKARCGVYPTWKRGIGLPAKLLGVRAAGQRP